MEVEEDGSQLLSKLEDTDALSPVDHCIRREQELHVARALDLLTEKEQRVLKLRYGFGSGKNLSLRTTSKLVGMSQEGVRRVERNAIKKLRRPSANQMISGLL
jgi:RNA polymerase sigma factor (sigma-70 family)